MLLFLASGITVSLLVLGLTFVAINALAAKAEYRRQELQQKTNALREKNQTLRCELSHRTALSRVSTLATAAGMRPADPAIESDFLALPAEKIQNRTHQAGWFSRGPLLADALNRQLRLTRLTGRAVAATTTTNTQNSVSH
jgi:hypothetical protein